MPSALQPDPSDVVEVFVGDTLEEAMAYAVASLGPDLVVRRARKVKKNLVGKDRYEVLAGPGAPPPSTDAVGSAFDALLQQAEAEETPTPVRRTTRPAPPVEATVVEPRSPEPPATPALAAPVVEPSEAPVTDRVVEPVVVEVVEVAEPPVVQAAPAPAAVGADPEPATQTAAEPVAVAPGPKAPAKRAPRKAPAKARKAPAKQAAPTGWSRQRLAELGLPEAVLTGMHAEDPTSDLHWAAALAEAIDAVLPPAAVLSEESPLVVDGYGLKGVLGILDAATRGFTPGSLVLGDRTVPATAAEMALVVRQAVLS